MKPNWKLIGKRLKAKLNSKRGYEILDKCAGGTWTAGGCFYLSTVLSKMLPGEMVSLWGKCKINENFGGYCKKIAQHSTFEVEPNCYLDGDGFSTTEQLVARWEKEEQIGDIDLLPANENLDAFDILVTYEAIETLKSFLEPVFKEYLKQLIIEDSFKV